MLKSMLQSKIVSATRVYQRSLCSRVNHESIERKKRVFHSGQKRSNSGLQAIANDVSPSIVHILLVDI